MAILFVDSKGDAVELEPGDAFITLDKKGCRSAFQFLGIMPQEDDCDYYLFSLDDCTYKNVELNWLEERDVIKMGGVYDG